MASTKSLKFLRPLMMPVDGRAIFLNDSVSVATNPAANDTSEFLLPAGFELSTLRFKVPDMDASTGLAGKIGFASASGGTTVNIDGAAVANDDDYFRAAAALGQAAAVIECDFLPITFQEDVKIVITWTVTASGAFTAGTVYMTAAGNANGPR